MIRIVRIVLLLLLAALSRADSDTKPAPTLPTIEVAQAVMVTADLDFGTNVPSIADALQQIERRYVPTDGQGRTFAILDAYGESTPEGKLRISMHVSTEKEGEGALVFRRTGAVLWKNRIVPATHPPGSAYAGKKLFILLDDGKGKPQVLDGSRSVSTILDVLVRDTATPVREMWLDGAEREITFFYSACGCPVKITAKRVGENTVRMKDQPVIFPDDPGVVTTITQLMQW